MALGVCCEWMVPSSVSDPSKTKNILISRSLQLSRLPTYSEDHIRTVYLKNVANLLEVLGIAAKAGIKQFRISSGMFPLYDKVPRAYTNNEEVIKGLTAIGKFAIENGIRITTHPGQFVVLSSLSEQVAANSIREMDFWGWVFDMMGLPRTPFYNINIHGGKKDAAQALVTRIGLLSPGAKSRMTLENEEFCYGVAELLPISKATGVPIVFDSHHHTFNTSGLDCGAALGVAMGTWPIGIKPTTHLSNSSPEFDGNLEASVTKRRKHGEYIRNIPAAQLEVYKAGAIDIEVEARAKNLAVFDVRKTFGIE